MSRVTLITGAAGFAGSHLLDLLTDSRADSTDPGPHDGLVGWYRPGRQAGRPRGTTRRPDITWEAVDILDRSSVIDAVARLRPAVVYHCAGAAHVGKAWERTVATFELNVRGTHHVIDGLCRAGAEARLLVPGSALVYRLGERGAHRGPSAGPGESLRREQAGAGAVRTPHLDAGRENHDRPRVQSLRPPAGSRLLDLRIRAADRGDRGRPPAARNPRRQPRCGPRSHRRARHGSCVPRDRGARPARAPVQRVLGAGRGHSGGTGQAHRAGAASPFA